MIKKVDHNAMMASIKNAVDGPVSHAKTESTSNAPSARRELYFTPQPTDTGVSVEEMVRRQEMREAGEAVSDTTNTGVTSGFSGTGLMRVPLSLIIKNPKYQNRLALSEEHIESLRLQFRASKQQEPIKVRRVGERFELIKGHHRLEAAIREGWPDIEAIVVEMDDRTARLEAMLSNAGRLDETDFERALAFRALLDKNNGYFKTQAQVGEAYGGLTQGMVSRILSMLELPEPILDILKKYPGIISATTARALMEILEQHPDQIDIIVNGVNRILEGNDETSIKAWILQAIQHAKGAAGKEAKARPRIVADPHGATVYSLRTSKPNQIVIDIKADIPASEVEALVFEALSKRAFTTQ